MTLVASGAGLGVTLEGLRRSSPRKWALVTPVSDLRVLVQVLVLWRAEGERAFTVRPFLQVAREAARVLARRKSARK